MEDAEEVDAYDSLLESNGFPLQSRISVNAGY
jgi:hypothetical protein